MRLSWIIFGLLLIIPASCQNDPHIVINEIDSTKPFEPQKPEQLFIELRSFRYSALQQAFEPAGGIVFRDITSLALR